MHDLNWRLSTLLTHALRVLGMLAVFPGRRDKLRLLRVWLELEGRYWSGRQPDRSLEVRWRGPAGPVSARLRDVSELWAVWETFARGEYAAAAVAGTAPRVILDLGANVGTTTLYFNAVCPEARIIAVEPVPHTYDLLRENTRHLENVTCVHAAVTDAVGVATIHSGARSLASSLTPDEELETAHEVPAVTLEHLADAVGIEKADVVKMDIEGAEAQVIRASAAWLSAAETIVFEFHQAHTATTLWELLDLLPAFEVARIQGDTKHQAVVDLARRRSAR